MGDADREGVLSFPSSIPNASTLRMAPQALERWTFDAHVPVRVHSLDSVLRDLEEPSVGLLKIDCQGAEYEILEHASAETLARIDRIILEFTDGARTLPATLRARGFDVTWDAGIRGYLRAVRRRST